MKNVADSRAAISANFRMLLLCYDTKGGRRVPEARVPYPATRSWVGVDSHQHNVLMLRFAVPWRGIGSPPGMSFWESSPPMGPPERVVQPIPRIKRDGRSV